MTLRHRMSWRRTAALTAVLVLATSCTGKEPGSPPGKDDPMQTMAVAEVKALAESRAQAVATTVGIPLDDWRTNTSPCVGKGGEIADDGRWKLTGFAGLAEVAPAEQVTTLHRIRDMWQQGGYEITEDRTFDDGGGAVSMRDPETAITMSLFSTKNRDGIGLILASACYMPVAGEDPANV